MNKSFVYEVLDKLIPNPVCELNYTKDYELLIAVMLSAQTTDKRVNMVTESLFKKYDTLEKLSLLSLSEIESHIKSIGLYRAKAKNLKSIVSDILNLGYFPKTREELESLSGVGRKTASVVLGELYNIPAMPVDTHIIRVSKRLGLASKKDDTLKIEKKLCKFFDEDKYSRVHKQLVLFGRYHCTSKNPKCTSCPFKEFCKHYKNEMK